MTTLPRAPPAPARPGNTAILRLGGPVDGKREQANGMLLDRPGMQSWDPASGKDQENRRDQRVRRRCNQFSFCIEAVPMMTLELLMPPYPDESACAPTLDQFTLTVTVTMVPAAAVVMSIGEVVTV
jgi:hypothetical protein